MKIVLAPDSFKGTLSAPQAAAVMGRAVGEIFPEAAVLQVPMADGGEGTAEAITVALGGKKRHLSVSGPLGKEVVATFGMVANKRLAVIDMAQSSGLNLALGGNIWQADTRGVGQLVRAALEEDPEQIIIGLGGSGTNDGGAGFLVGLGARLLDENGHELAPVPANLAQVSCIDTSGLDRKLLQTQIVLACDVTNPLSGEGGASFVYAPQKGASADDLPKLDAALSHFGKVLARTFAKEVTTTPGAGAAGGLGAGILAATNARVVRGVDAVIDAVGLKAHLVGADWVFTGEGRLDGQSAFGKAPVGVAEAARAKAVPALCFAGNVTDEAYKLVPEYFAAIFSTMQRVVPLEIALAECAPSLYRAVANACRTIRETLEMVAKRS